MDDGTFTQSAVDEELPDMCNDARQRPPNPPIQARSRRDPR
jgi:hypothetical protein